MKKLRKRGYGTEAIRLMLSLAFDHYEMNRVAIKYLIPVCRANSVNYIVKAHDFKTKNLSAMCFFYAYFISGGILADIPFL